MKKHEQKNAQLWLGMQTILFDKYLNLVSVTVGHRLSIVRLESLDYRRTIELQISRKIKTSMYQNDTK